MSVPSTDIHTVWRKEASRLLAWLGMWAGIGLLSHHLLGALVIGLSLYLLLHMGYIYKMHSWLLQHKSGAPPDGTGLWQDIFQELYKINRRNERRGQRLKRIVNEFQASTAALPDGAVVIDCHDQIIWFNKAATALFALRTDRDRGQRITNLIRHPRFADFLARADENSSALEVPSRVNDMSILSLRIIPYGNGQRLLIARDISEQKRLESTRRDFVANASHELRTPLTVLCGYLEIMRDESTDAGALADWQSPIHEMQNQSARMKSIIADLLSLAQLESEGTLQAAEVIDVPKTIKRVVATQQDVNTDNHSLILDVDPALSLLGHTGEIESVINNLLTNAVRYTPAHGEITVRWQAERGGAVLAVADNGPGIDAEHVSRLTERFYRADPGRASSTGGTGLGLSIVKHCLQHHQADLNIESEPDQGSTFSCYFPQERLIDTASAETAREPAP